MPRPLAATMRSMRGPLGPFNPTGFFGIAVMTRLQLVDIILQLTESRGVPLATQALPQQRQDHRPMAGQHHRRLPSHLRLAVVERACRSPSSSANATTASSARLGARMPSRFTACCGPPPAADWRRRRHTCSAWVGSAGLSPWPSRERQGIGRCWPLQEGPNAVFRGMQRPLNATGLPPRIGPMLAKPSGFLLPSPWLTARRTPAAPRAGTRARAPRSAGRARRPRPAAGRWSTRPSHAGG